jgi:cytochrome c-type biogenesis protein CcmH/NrfF
VNLLWTVPVVAAALATALVAARARALEDATVDLAVEIRRLRELRPRLARVRVALRDTRERAAELRRRHSLGREDDTS